VVCRWWEWPSVGTQNSFKTTSKSEWVHTSLCEIASIHPSASSHCAHKDQFDSKKKRRQRKRLSKIGSDHAASGYPQARFVCVLLCLLCTDPCITGCCTAPQTPHICLIVINNEQCTDPCLIVINNEQCTGPQSASTH